MRTANLLPLFSSILIVISTVTARRPQYNPNWPQYGRPQTSSTSLVATSSTIATAATVNSDGFNNPNPPISSPASSPAVNGNPNTVGVATMAATAGNGNPDTATNSVTSATRSGSTSSPTGGSPPPSTGGIAQGFNYDANVDFQTQFNAAKNLVGTSGFTSARLYTMIQPGIPDSPISAIQAAINTGTTLLLGMYLDNGDTAFASETSALSNAITQYGSAFTDLIVGISVGSEDLYRASVGQKGDTPGNIVKYIGQVRTLLQQNNLNKPIGHVDTWGAWTQQGGGDLLAAVDFVGADAYPYWQGSAPDEALNALDTAIQQTQSFAGSKPVWITETGWPVSWPANGSAIPSVANAQAYWKNVGCTLFGKTNTWWYTLNDAGLTNGDPSFGITCSASNTNPLFPLAC